MNVIGVCNNPTHHGGSGIIQTVMPKYKYILIFELLVQYKICLGWFYGCIIKPKWHGNQFFQYIALVVSIGSNAKIFHIIIIYGLNIIFKRISLKLCIFLLDLEENKVSSMNNNVLWGSLMWALPEPSIRYVDIDILATLISKH